MFLLGVQVDGVLEERGVHGCCDLKRGGEKWEVSFSKVEVNMHDY